MNIGFQEKRRGRTWCTWVASVILAGAFVSSAGTKANASNIYTVNAVADSYVYTASPNTNFGATNLVVQQNINNEYRSYIKFDLTSIPGLTVTSATLWLRLRSIGAATTVKVYSCDDDSWTNNGITWNNQPATGTPQASIDVSTAGLWYEADITSWVASQFGGNKVVSVVIRDDEYLNRNSQYYSIETGAGAYEPHLVIEVEGAPEPKTISGRVTLDGTGLAGVTLTGLPGSPMTESDGTYIGTVYTGWSGTVAPSRMGYTFEPASRTYTDIQADLDDQDYSGETMHMAGWPFYTPNSYWNYPIQQAPVDPNSDYYIENWKSVSSNHHLRMGGMDGSFGFQLYYGTESDPVWTVTNIWTGKVYQFRGPSNMTPSPGDSELVCIDLTQDGGRGVLYAFGGISGWNQGWPFGDGPLTGRSPYSKVHYIKSNGLEGTLPYANDRRNYGHRGLAMMIFGPMIGDVQAQHVPHMIKLVVPRTGKSPFLPRDNHVWPYSGNEGDTTDLPEGARVRLKASVQPRIDAMENPYARAIAQAFLTYGAIIGDQGGQGATTNMQTGPGTAEAWAAMGITGTSLYEFTIDDFEVVELGWVPPGM